MHMHACMHAAPACAGLLSALTSSWWKPHEAAAALYPAWYGHDLELPQIGYVYLQ